MSFSMSGVSDGYSYNRFDLYEKKSKDCDCKSEKDCDCDDKKSKGKGPRWQDSDGDGKWYEPGEDVKEEVEQDGPKPTESQSAGAQKNILSKLRLLKNKQGEETKQDKQELALQKARAKAFGMKEEKAESERSDAMPAGDVGHDIHKRAVKSYNKNNPSTKVKEELESTGLFSEQEISVILEALLGKN